MVKSVVSLAKRRRLSTLLNSLALVFDAVFIILSVWNDTFSMDPTWYAGLRAVMTLLSMGARVLQQKTLSTPIDEASSV